MKFELYLEIACVCFCFLHFIISLIVGIVNGKKLEKLCPDCHQPIFVGEDHKCVSLSIPSSLGDVSVRENSKGYYEANLPKEVYEFLISLYEVNKSGK